MKTTKFIEHVEDQMPTCPECHTEVRPAARFCHKCGTRVEIAEQAKPEVESLIVIARCAKTKKAFTMNFRKTEKRRWVGSQGIGLEEK